MEPRLEPQENDQAISSVSSLKELLDLISGRTVHTDFPQEDSGLAEIIPYPFLGLVGQFEMKLALLLAIINPLIGGVLLVGPRGTGKTTAVRSLLKLLPEVHRSSCFYGCTPEDIEAGGLDAVCPECAKKYGEGKPLTKIDQVRLVELPLNTQLEDVIGKLTEHEVTHERYRLKRGILSQADLNVLYTDEVNLLQDEIIDAILNAASEGSYSIRRGSLFANYKARFTLIGSMNPEEGSLRPQIMDRFGLRVIVRGLNNQDERYEAYKRVLLYRKNPHHLVSQYSAETEYARKEIIAARFLLPHVTLPEDIARAGLTLIKELQIDSLRAEIALFEAARALAAADARSSVIMDDLRVVAPIALRLRRSDFISRYFTERDLEETTLSSILHRLIPQIEEK